MFLKRTDVLKLFFFFYIYLILGSNALINFGKAGYALSILVTVAQERGPF